MFAIIRSEYGRRVRVLIPLPDRDFDVTEVAVPVAPAHRRRP